MMCGSVRKVIVNDPLRDDSHLVENRSYVAADDATLEQLALTRTVGYN